ncbi:MAG: leucyl aminopeptidase, partial [Phenylobacterium sp.]
MNSRRPLVLAGLGLALAVLPASVAAAPKPVPAARPSEAPPWKTATLRRPVSFAEVVQAKTGVLVVAAGSAAEAGERVSALVSPEAGAAARSAAESAKFDFTGGETLVLRGFGGLDQVVLMGLGKGSDPQSLHVAGEALGRSLAQVRAPVTVAAGPVGGEGLAALATGFGIGEYRSDLLSSDRPSRTPEPVVFSGTGATAAETLYLGRGEALVEAVQWTRDVSNLPANLMYPETFVESARAAFAGVPGVAIEVLDEAAMKRLGMGALSGVGMGSTRPPRLLVVRYRGAGATAEKPLVLAGKGITFDSGGISLKPGSGMGEMKMDMSGAASVTG